MAPFPKNDNNFGENTKPDDYDSLVHDAPSSIPTVIIPKLSLPKEILGPDNSTYGGKIVVYSSATDGDFEVEEERPNEKFDSPENNRTIATRSGRLSRVPAGYLED